jgi:cyclohexa-1,5-dienecarbonyl-CoA hydratase
VTQGPVRVEPLEGGAVLRVVVGGSKGNIVDRAVTEALSAVVAAVRVDPAVKAVLLEGDGAHFSFGASVPEHLPDQVEGMLRRFHALLLDLLDASVVVLVAVRGRCLGGGLELAMCGHRVFAHPGALLGQPEIVLGVVAPFASAFLAERVGRPVAEDLLLTGRTVAADEALRTGLVDELADDPTAAALAWARAELLPKSASTLRFAVRAARHGLVARLRAELDALERLYLHDLMATADAREGLDAFLAKRPPVWRGR